MILLFLVVEVGCLENDNSQLQTAQIQHCILDAVITKSHQKG